MHYVGNLFARIRNFFSITQQTQLSKYVRVQAGEQSLTILKSDIFLTLSDSHDVCPTPHVKY